MTAPEHKDLVILLHGILRSKTDMAPLALYLKNKGYATPNILYPSRKMPIEKLVDLVAGKIEEQRTDHQTLHFVAHSMGSLITRAYIDKYKPQNLGRVVMLSPPNQGSDLADELLKNKFTNPLYRKAFGPAGSQLTTTDPLKSEPLTYPLGIIAGSKSINPIAPLLLPRKRVGDHDGIVPVKRTKLEGMTDHITLPVTHSFMMFRPAVMAQVYAFLKEGKFT